MHDINAMGRIWFVGLGTTLAGALSCASVFAADKLEKPIEDGSKIMITSPKHGEKVNDSFELTFKFAKGSKAAHAHVFVDNEYQKGFQGVFNNLSKGTHLITVTGATKNHVLLTATHTIIVDVQ